MTGKRREISRTVRGTRREAQRVLNEMALEIDRGNFSGTGTSAMFHQLTNRWLDMAKNELRPTTMRRYEILLRRHIHPALCDVSVKNIKTIDLDQLYVGLQRRSGLGPTTVRQVHAIIHRALSTRIAARW